MTFRYPCATKSSFNITNASVGYALSPVDLITRQGSGVVTPAQLLILTFYRAQFKISPTGTAQPVIGPTRNGRYPGENSRYHAGRASASDDNSWTWWFLQYAVVGASSKRKNRMNVASADFANVNRVCEYRPDLSRACGN